MEIQQPIDISLRNRNQLPWDEAIWNRIDRAVHDECKRTKVAAKFLPYHHASPNELTIPSDTVILSGEPGEQRLAIDEVAINPLIELVVEFKLTVQQVEREAELGTAVTLATRAANLISQAEDIAIFQGQSAIAPGENQHPLFRDRKVIVKSGSAGLGLLNAPDFPGSNSDIQIVSIPPLEPNETPPRWGENTFAAVSNAYSRLQSGDGLAQAHYGPYVCVLNFRPYADTYAPLATTLIIPADRIKPLVTAMASDKDMHICEAEIQTHKKDMHAYGRDMSYMNHLEYSHYYGTGTLPLFKGVFLSLGGDTMDLVVGADIKTEYTSQDKDGSYCYRAYSRFVNRLKDPTSVIRFDFHESSSEKISKARQ